MPNPTKYDLLGKDIESNAKSIETNDIAIKALEKEQKEMKKELEDEKLINTQFRATVSTSLDTVTKDVGSIKNAIRVITIAVIIYVCKALASSGVI